MQKTPSSASLCVACVCALWAQVRCQQRGSVRVREAHYPFSYCEWIVYFLLYVFPMLQTLSRAQYAHTRLMTSGCRRVSSSPTTPGRIPFLVPCHRLLLRCDLEPENGVPATFAAADHPHTFTHVRIQYYTD